jgi:glucosamine--fructose-6-phosphate aminotransferase (isomerizing)
MCGIVGYAGKKSAQPILFNGLSKLEYRGYDSCGIALESPELLVRKDAVRVAALQNSLPSISGKVGIGHTRWATHGIPNRTNAHPHIDCSGKIAVVHNGIIANYLKIKHQLISEGHVFTSDTDTEVISHLVEKYYESSLLKAVESVLKEIQGSYAIIVIKEGDPGLVFARKDSPLIIGTGDREYFLASDVTAILEYTDKIIYLEDGDCGYVTAESLLIRNYGAEVKRNVRKVDWTPHQAQKGGYEHYMLKEIHEQPRVVRESIIESLSSNGSPNLPLLEGKVRNLLVLACGSSYHAALLTKYVAGTLNMVPPNVEIASEFNSFTNIWQPALAVCLTQSGETADTLKAMRALKKAGSRVVAITNVLGSTASKIADLTIYTRAGPEISVAATKSFTSQLITIYGLALKLAKLDPGIYEDLTNELRQIPDKIQQVLDIEDSISVQAERLAAYRHVYFIGRGLNYPIAMEGALKMKEVSYIHAEAYPAGELKHGPFSLLGKETPVVTLVARDSNYEAMLTGIKEIKARGAPVYAIAAENDDEIQNLADYVIQVPVTNSLFVPVINTVVVQLLAYFTAKKLGCSIDFPRNLAKSVTVE